MENNVVSAFALSPMAIRVKLQPGETYTKSLKIINPVSSTETLHYKISVIPYSDLGIDEGVDFSKNSVYARIMDWVTIDEPEGYLEPNETKTVNYTITVPEDAKESGQYCAIAVRNVPNTAGGESGVAISDVIEITSLIYGQVGNVNYGGEILNATMPSFSFNNEITSIASVHNTGNVHQDVQIRTKVSSAFTGEPVYLDLTAEEQELLELGLKDEIGSADDYYSEIVMPETTKTVSHTLDGMPMIGIYNVEQNVTFAGKSEVLNRQIVICPIWFVVIVILVLAGIVFGLSMLGRHLCKKHKKAKTSKKRAM